MVKALLQINGSRTTTRYCRQLPRFCQARLSDDWVGQQAIVDRGKPLSANTDSPLCHAVTQVSLDTLILRKCARFLFDNANRGRFYSPNSANLFSFGCLRVSSEKLL